MHAGVRHAAPAPSASTSNAPLEPCPLTGISKDAMPAKERVWRGAGHLAVGDPAVVQQLQENVHHVRMRLLSLVEQDDAVGVPPAKQHASLLSVHRDRTVGHQLHNKNKKVPMASAVYALRRRPLVI